MDVGTNVDMACLDFRARVTDRTGCQRGLMVCLSDMTVRVVWDLLTHCEDPVEETLVYLAQEAKPCQAAEGEGGLNEAVVKFSWRI